MRAIKNIHAPVNRLPPEILSRVLLYRDREQDIVVATHVCQYWRSTLISTPSLWTFIQFQSAGDIDRAVAYLERSKALTVDISMELDSSQDLDVPRYFAPHMSRTRSFAISGRFDAFTVSSLLTNPVPSLEHLKLHTEVSPVGTLDNFLARQAPLLPSAIFDGICPALQSPFPLPSLTVLSLRLLRNMGPLTISSLLRFCSSFPQLQELNTGIYCEIIHDVSSDQVVSLDSLVTLQYTDHAAVGPFIPFLKLPRLSLLSVFSPWLYNLADFLPHSGHTLHSGATTLSHCHDHSTQRVELSGRGVKTSFLRVDDNDTDATSAEWFSDENSIPFGQIEDLDLLCYRISADFPIHLFENLTTIRVTQRFERVCGGVLQLLHPCPEAGIPCPFLRVIEYTFSSSPESHMRFLISLAEEREQAGYRLRLVHVLGWQIAPDLEGELRSHVGELCVGKPPGNQDYC